MGYDVSTAARALMALEVVQNSPGITARQLGDRLGVLRCGHLQRAIEALGQRLTQAGSVPPPG